MRKIKTRSLLTIILAMLCAVLLGCTAGLLSGRTGKNAKAYAPSSSTAIDLTLANYEKRTDGKAINPYGLAKLFDALTGVQYSTIDDVTALTDMDAYQLKSNGLVVNFGGRTWNGVYFTHNTAGEPILTLWLADNSEVEANFSYNSGGTSYQTPTYLYPADMYSTSELRVKTLNAGGDAGGLTYATGYNDCSGTVDTDRKQNPFAAFTLSSNLIGNKSLTKYIEVPNNIAYQQDENFVDVSYAKTVRYVLQNDALGIPKATTKYDNARWYVKSGVTYNYSGVATGTTSADAVNTYVDSSRYTEWGGDYLWLPSITETGYYDSSSVQSPGIWNVNQEQRKSSGENWTRTGWPGDCRYVVQINGDGSFEDNGGGRRTHELHYVRPALHLNLATMETGAITDPVDVTTELNDEGGRQAIVYNESAKNLDAVLPEWYLNCEDFYNEFADITYSYKNTGDTTAFDTANPGTATPAASVIKAGRYEITITLKSNSPYCWYDGTTPVTEKKVILTVKQKEVKFDYKIFSNGSTTPLTGDSVTYDPVKTYVVKPYSATETIPTGTTNLFPDWTMEYEGTANDGTVYTKSTTVPTKAGSYKATIKDANAGTSNYLLKGSVNVYNYTVAKAEVSLPSFSKDKDTYTAKSLDFALADYDTAILKIDGISAGSVTLTANGAKTQFADADSYFVVDYDATNKKLSAINSATYTVTFGLVDSDNYTWASAIASDPKTKTFTVEKRELVINFLSPLSNKSNFNLKTSSKGNITAEYATNGGACTPDGGSEEEPMLNLYYTFAGTGTVAKTQLGSTAKIGDVTLDITTLKGDGNVFSVGTYTLTFELAPDGVAAVNKNYTLGTSASQTVTVTAGEASIDDIQIVYNTARGENDGDANAAIPTTGLTYAYDKTYGATEFKIYLDFSGISYLDYANGTSSLTYTYSDGTHTINKAGKVTVTAVIKSADSNYSLPAIFDVTATNKFKSYTNNGDGTATITFEIEINKAVATVDAKEIPLKYQREGSSDVLDYDSKKPPQYNGKPVTITLGSSALFPDAVKSVVFDDTLIRQTTAGDYTIRATVTLSDNYETLVGSSTVIVNIPWSIAKEQIDLVWTNMVYADEYFDDSTLAHLQITLLSLTTAQEGNVEYEFYKEESDGSMSAVPMTLAEIKALCTNDRFTETTPTYIYVKAVLTESGAKKYQLEDDDTKNPRRLRLGGNMTQINLSVNQSLDGLEYGDGLDVSKLFTLTNSETGDVWDSDYYEITVRKDGVTLCSLADFKPNEADAGDYTFVIDIKPEYAESYVLDKSNKVNFVINPKALELPTLSEILFSGEYISVENYLGGSWAQIKDLVKLGGDYKDIRNVSASGYILVLELTDGNYCWAYPENTESPVKALLRYSATDVEITPVSATTASMKWNITPLVVDTTSLWVKGSGGATLNLPEAVTKLITGETLTVGYRYYDDAGQYIETPELKGGKSFRVEAVFGGIDAEQGNVLFKTSDNNLSATSDRISYTVPQSGAAALLGNVKDFVTKTWLGLPIWAWLAIALAVLILLIIIIAVACKRRKNKEQRAEEKARKEEERQRREEERRLQQERIEAERELAKAKQEAELEKIRAQAGMAGVGMATMSMQQPMQQPQMQQQPQMPQQPAQQTMSMQMPQQQPQYQQMPVQMPQSAPAQSSGGGVGATEMMAMMFAQLAGMKADSADKEIAALKSEKEITALKTELEIMKLKLENLKDSRNVPLGENMRELTPEFLGAVIASAMRGNGLPAPSVAELPAPETDTANVHAVYPPDAVVTTTTTVDTTQKPVRRTERDSRDEFADVDGFYDSID